VLPVVLYEKLRARNARKVDTLPVPLMDEVLAKIATLFE
jgi:mRNA interferase ChpB